MQRQISNIKGYEEVKDNYFITDEGDVLTTGRANLKNKPPIKKLKLYKKTGGYLNVCLATKTGEYKFYRVHRIVANAFIPNTKNKPYVNHKDEKRSNNKYKNLEWVTPKENNLWSISKKVYVYDLDGNWIKNYTYTRECKKDGFNQGHVCACCRGEERSHKKHIFSYEELTKEEVVELSKKPFYTKGKRYEQLKEAKKK